MLKNSNLASFSSSNFVFINDVPMKMPHVEVYE
jgi:hypothetical protein